MARFFRLIFVGLCLLGGVAHAGFPPVSTEYKLQDFWGATFTWKTSAAAACAAGIGISDGYYVVVALSPSGSASCSGTKRHTPGQGCADCTPVNATHEVSLITREVPGSCVQNSEFVNGQCVCKAGFQQTSGSDGPQCAPMQCEKFGSPVIGTGSSTVHKSAGYDGGLVCHNGCSVFPSTSGQLEGTWYANGPFTYTGAKCTAKDDNSGGGGEAETEEPEFDPIPGACVAGKCPGQMNGTDVCVTCDSTRTDKVTEETKETTNPDGTKSSETTKTETTIKCEGNTCTTTTKTTTTTGDGSGSGGGGGGGGGGGSSSTTEGEKKETKEDFCKSNPKVAMCAEKGETSFGGSCAGGFQAKSDDAVLNAMAQEQHKRNCELLAKEGAEQSEVNSEMQKDKTNVTTDNPNNSEVDMSSRINTSDALGGGSCELNKEIVVQGRSFTLPFNNLCGSLGMLGNLLVAVAMLLAGRIITRG